ncbi:MAG: hypothetical protein PF517_05060 [Salinivirgaceae bacterium]|jgi:preprotein translocase subunit SecB|nr:hypothetical protein [Salinivirgaceae bacterium]
MKAHKAPLILDNFALLNHSYNFLAPPKNKVNIPELTNSYLIDIDFALTQLADNIFQLFTKISVNSIEKPKPGYKLFIEGVCIFSFDESEPLTGEEKSHLLNYYGLNICINSLRNILATTTANGPLGKYTLPAIDVNKLLADKQAR